jgi:hypothetical protein
MALLLVTLRRANNSKKELSCVFIGGCHKELVKTLFNIPMQAEYDEEASKYFLIIEEILLALK